MSEVSKHGRQGRPKVRTGCATCKFRRVKCDETKPHCQRCTKFGRKCGGYGAVTTRGSKAEDNSREAIAFIKPRPVLLSYGLNPSMRGSNDERRYFHLFSQSTCVELSGCFDSVFWAQIVLQTSTREPSIWHALTAIAALSRMGAEKAPDMSQPMGTAKTKDEHYRFGIRQYNMAITSLRNTIASGKTALRTSLIACILFVCIEAIQGDQVAASGQVHGGLHLMQQVYRSRRQLSEDTKQATIEDEITQIYANMNVQSFFLVFSQLHHHPHVHSTQAFHGHIFSTSIPRFFTTISEAKTVLDLILQSIVQLVSTSDMHTATTPTLDNYAQHHAHLRSWECAFQPLLLRAKSASATAPDAKAPLVLSAYHRVGFIILAGALSHKETRYDSLYKDFSAIVSCCRSVRDSNPAPSPHDSNSNSSNNNNNNNSKLLRSPRLDPPQPRFSFQVGILPPLFVVGSKCRDPTLRREAIALMKSCPFQEGLWEPFSTSRICEWMMGIEELGLVISAGGGGGGAAAGGFFVPERSRVCLSGMKCHVDARRIWVQCRGAAVLSEEGGLEGRGKEVGRVWETVIEW